jgi:hypothetical protein
MRHRCLASFSSARGAPPPLARAAALEDSLSSRGPQALGALAIAIALVWLTPVSVATQGPAAANAPTAADTWAPPRTPDGQPDLQGVWANNNATPLERPKQLAGRAVLTDEELTALKAKATELFHGDGDAAFGDSVFEAALADAQNFTSRDAGTGNYNHFWLVERDWDNRTSLIADPPDGRLPPLTPEAEQRRAAAAGSRQRPAAGPEDRSLSERCITFGVPRLGAGYNSYYQIFQSRDHVVLAMETIHDARVIPLDGRPHAPQAIRQWHGDSRGRWEGDTLVIDTTNYSPKSNFMGSTESLHIIERFTRVRPDVLKYEITVDDPKTWIRPWTAMIPLRRGEDKIYEFACHEGNEGMVGILSGARAQEEATGGR